MSTRYTIKSLVVFCPIEHYPLASAMAAATKNPSLFSIMASPDGNEPATHRGIHTNAMPEFLALLSFPIASLIAVSSSEDQKSLQSLLNYLLVVGEYTEQDITDMQAQLIVSADPDIISEKTKKKIWGQEHVDHVLLTNNLQRVSLEEDE